MKKLLILFIFILILGSCSTATECVYEYSDISCVMYDCSSCEGNNGLVGWFRSILPETAMGHILVVALLSLTPFIGVRASIPYGIIVGLPWYIVLPVAIISDFAPVPFLIFGVKKVFKWVKERWGKLGRWVERVEQKALSKAERVLKYRRHGLFFFGALPIPGTGTWMGSLIAALLDMPKKEALPPIFAGVVVCAVILTIISVTGVAAFQWILS